jgi:hypothetical protein
MTFLLLVATWGTLHFEHIFYMEVISVFSESFVFLGPCANFRRVTIIFMSVYLSVHIQRLDSHWTDFRNIIPIHYINQPVNAVERNNRWLF